MTALVEADLDDAGIELDPGELVRVVLIRDPTKTTGSLVGRNVRRQMVLAFSGSSIDRPRRRPALLTAAVAPEPTKTDDVVRGPR